MTAFQAEKGERNKFEDTPVKAWALDPKEPAQASTLKDL